MTNVASDYLCDIELFDSGGVKVGEKYQVTPGAECVLEANELVGGAYHVQIHYFGGRPIRGEGNKPVAAFELQSYKLEVQQ
jgi:hypothetical protein